AAAVARGAGRALRDQQRPRGGRADHPAAAQDRTRAAGAALHPDRARHRLHAGAGMTLVVRTGPATVLTRVGRALAAVRNAIKAVLPQTLLGRALMIIVTPAIMLQLLLLVVFYDYHYDLITRRLAAAVVSEVAAMNVVHDLIDDELPGQAELIAFQRLELRMR